MMRQSFTAVLERNITFSETLGATPAAFRRHLRGTAGPDLPGVRSPAAP